MNFKVKTFNEKYNESL